MYNFLIQTVKLLLFSLSICDSFTQTVNVCKDPWVTVTTVTLDE